MSMIRPVGSVTFTPTRDAARSGSHISMKAGVSLSGGMNQFRAADGFALVNSIRAWPRDS